MIDNEIIKALECCITNKCDECAIYKECHNENGKGRVQVVLDLINRQKTEIERLQSLVDEMSDYFPTCIGCEGKTTLGERTDECVYLIGNTEYCAKRGIENIGRIMRENRELKEMTEVREK